MWDERQAEIAFGEGVHARVGLVHAGLLHADHGVEERGRGQRRRPSASMVGSPLERMARAQAASAEPKQALGWASG